MMHLRIFHADVFTPSSICHCLCFTYAQNEELLRYSCLLPSWNSQVLKERNKSKQTNKKAFSPRLKDESLSEKQQRCYEVFFKCTLEVSHSGTEMKAITPPLQLTRNTRHWRDQESCPRLQKQLEGTRCLQGFQSDNKKVEHFAF